MGLEFDRPVGCHADEAELLYVSALHQTGEIRQDASINAEDIRNYLLSRHGLDVPLVVVRDVILNKNDSLDLISLIGTIFVPTIAKIAAPLEETRDLETLCPHVLNRVSTMILHDVTGDTEPKALTASLVRDIFLKYGEYELIEGNDEYLQAVLQAATGGEEDVLFDEKSLLRALTHDLGEYNVRREASITTNMTDVFGNCCDIHDQLEKTLLSEMNNDEEEEYDLGITCNEQIEKLNIPKTVHTGQGFDFVAGTYSCKYQAICVWTFFAFTFMAYINDFTNKFENAMLGSCPKYNFLTSWQANAAPFRCGIGRSILEWLILFAAIILTGFIVVWLGCVGYEVESKNRPRIARLSRYISNLLLLCVLLVGPIVSGVNTSNPLVLFLRIISIVFGSFLMFLRITRELYDDTQMSNLCPGAYQGTAVLHESQLKRAAACKVKTMMHNSIQIFTSLEEKSVIKAYYGQALSNYAKEGDDRKPTGGITWTWKRHFRDELYTEEGLWFSARFLSANFTTAIITFFVTLSGIWLTMYVHSSWIPQSSLDVQVVDRLESVLNAVADQSMVGEAVDKMLALTLDFIVNLLAMLENAGLLRLDCLLLSTSLTQLCEVSSNSTLSDYACNFFLDTDNVCGALEKIYRPREPLIFNIEERGTAFLEERVDIFNTTNLREPFVKTVSKVASDTIVSQVNNLYPRARYMVVAPCIVATIIASIASVSLTLSLIPSITATTLKLRSGEIPTLTSKSFQDYRWYIDSTTYITGCLFWGNLVASMLCGILFGGIVFLCLWQVSIVWVQRLVALLIGIGLVVLVRALFARKCRLTFYRGFYRIKPFAANIFALLNLCLNFALSTATVLIRMTKLIFLAVLYIGRIDTPFVANKVGDFYWFHLEAYHLWFLTDVLAVEAHRHPFIETLGSMYLMKLKYKSNFMNVIGSKWREIFVIALMPWLHKYRKIHRQGK